MDGRTLKLGMYLLIATAGCQRQVLTLPSSRAFSATGEPLPVPNAVQVKKTPAKPKELPPAVLVSSGDFKSGEAFAAGVDAERKQQISELARADYERALKVDPKCVAAYQGLARLYKSLHDFPQAVETYQKALKLAPRNATLWFELGLCHNHEKNLGPALECLERAVQIDPSNQSYVNALGVVLAEAGRHEESLNCFIRANGEAKGYYRLAQTLRHLQQPELSQRYLEVALQKDPGLAPPPPPIQQTAYRPAAVTPPPPPQVIPPPPPPINGE